MKTSDVIAARINGLKLLQDKVNEIGDDADAELVEQLRRDIRGRIVILRWVLTD